MIEVEITTDCASGYKGNWENKFQP